jgi:NADPH-dependent 2,4-dienoyl-CoA reductase/sulfur reductase-like enzyme
VSELVVVGGGAAGMSAASAARRVDPDLPIVVLEATGFAGYGLCGLPYHLSGVVESATDLLSYSPAFFRDRRRLDLRLGAAATEIDLARREVVYSYGGRTERQGFTSLVVAAGGQATVPPIPGLEGRRVFTVRTMEDTIALRELLDVGAVATAVVVGAGYIGLEAAEALHARGVRVTVVERLPRVLPTLDEPIAALVEEHVREHVDLRLSADAASALADVDPDVVVVCAGVRPAGGIAAAAGARTEAGGALAVDDHMRTSLPGVWAAGDCVAPMHRVLGRPAYVPLGPAANRTGRVAGTVAAGGEASFAGVVGTAVVKVFELEVARTGLTLAEARAEGVAATATDVVHKSRAKYYPGTVPLHVRLVHTQGGRLLGAQLVGREGAAKRVDVIATALYAGLDVDDLAALDLSYAPPYSPVYDPLLIAAQAAQRSLELGDRTAVPA